MKTCEWCGHPFTESKFCPKGTKRFCSTDCRQKWHWYEGRARASEQVKETS